jgi:hypothetical protein
MYKIKLDLPGTPKGEVVTIDGIGALENGATHEVSDEEAHAFRLAHPARVESVNDSTGETVVETTLGPTLYEAFKGHPSIKVTKVGNQGQEGS